MFPKVLYIDCILTNKVKYLREEKLKFISSRKGIEINFFLHFLSSVEIKLSIRVRRLFNYAQRGLNRSDLIVINGLNLRQAYIIARVSVSRAYVYNTLFHLS